MRFVVRPHRPIREFVLAVLSIALLALAGWLLFDYGQWRYIYQRMAASDEQRELWNLSRASELDNTRLRQRIAVLERAAQIDRQAYRELQDLVRRRQEEIVELQEEIGFYRSVLAAPRRERRLAIHALTVRPSSTPGTFHFKLVLTRAVNDDTLAEGAVDIHVEGSREGGQGGPELAALAPVELQRLPFELRHFYRIGGTFSLPGGFRPRRLRVELTEGDHERPSTIKTFDWDEVLRRGGDKGDVG